MLDMLLELRFLRNMKLLFYDRLIVKLLSPAVKRDPQPPLAPSTIMSYLIQ